MPKLIEDLIICENCGHEHGPTQAKHVTRFTCGHCGKQQDGENYEHPATWSVVMQGNVMRFFVCLDCLEPTKQFFRHCDSGIRT